MILSTYEAAATLTAGTDAFRNERQNVSSRPRWLKSVAVVGSAAINDAAVDIFIEDFYVGRFRNSRAGVAQVVHPDDDQKVGPHYIPAGAKLTAPIATAPGTNPLIIQLN